MYVVRVGNERIKMSFRYAGGRVCPCLRIRPDAHVRFSCQKYGIGDVCQIGERAAYISVAPPRRRTSVPCVFPATITLL